MNSRAKGETVSKGLAGLQRKSAEVYELRDLTVEEVSLVDRPAIAREFVVTKRTLVMLTKRAGERARGETVSRGLLSN